MISCMGAGNKLDPTRFEVADIYQTSVCPLARVMRRELKQRGIDALKVRTPARKRSSQRQQSLQCKPQTAAREYCVCPVCSRIDSGRGSNQRFDGSEGFRMSQAIWNWGILGPGHIAGVFAAALSGVETGAAEGCGVTQFEAGRGLRAKYQFETAYGSYAALAADPAVDVVYISSPMSCHAEHIGFVWKTASMSCVRRP